MATRSLLIEILGDAAGALGALNDTSGAATTFGGKLKAIMGGAGIAAGAALGAGFVANLDIEAGNDKLAASLGLTAEQAKEAGGVASRVYSGAWGESLDEVNDAVGSVMSTLGEFTNGSKDIELMTTRALDFATAFDSDVNTAVGNASVLLDTGLAKTADEAFDLMVAGMQNVPVAFRDGLTEATAEYSQFFAGFGFTGAEAMGVLVEASKGGAYMVDKVGDSIKEMSIKLRDGNKETSKALAGMFGGSSIDEEKLGKLADGVEKLRDKLAKAKAQPATPASGAAVKQLTADLATEEAHLKTMTDASTQFQGKFKQLTGDLAAGGPAAKAAFGEIATAISQIQDPVEKSQAAIAIFGTPFEDISGDATKMNDVLRTLATGTLPDVAGSAQRMGDTLNTNTGGKLESFKRKFEMATASIGGAVGPIGAALPAMGGLVTTMQGLGGVTRIATIAQAAFNFVMGLNPVVLVVIAVIALVAAVVLAYQKVDWFRAFVDTAFAAIKGAILGVWDSITAGFSAVKDWIGSRIEAIVVIFAGLQARATAIVGGLWSSITGGITGARDWIGAKVEDVVGFVTGLPGRIGRAASGMWDSISNGFKAVINFVIRGWNSLQFTIPGFKVGGVGFDEVRVRVPQIPMLADGGNVTRDGLAIVGERGAEVVSLPRGASVTPLGAGGGLSLVVPVSIDGREVARATVSYTRDELLKMAAGRRLGLA